MHREDGADVLGVFVERVAAPGVQVQCAERFCFREESKRQHALHTCLFGPPATRSSGHRRSEPRSPTITICWSSDGVETRTLTNLILDRVDNGSDLVVCSSSRDRPAPEPAKWQRGRSQGPSRPQAWRCDPTCLRCSAGRAALERRSRRSPQGSSHPLRRRSCRPKYAEGRDQATLEGEDPAKSATERGRRPLVGEGRGGRLPRRINGIPAKSHPGQIPRVGNGESTSRRGPPRGETNCHREELGRR